MSGGAKPENTGVGEMEYSRKGVDKEENELDFGIVALESYLG